MTDGHAPALGRSADGESAQLPTRPPGAWGRFWRAWYRLLRVGVRPLIGVAVRRGFGNLVVLRTVGRRSGVERSTLLGLLEVGGRRYLGHPNGDSAWTLNLRSASTATIEASGLPRWEFRPVALGPGTERDAVVRATTRQHPFPGNALYRLSGRHVDAFGVFFRLEPAERVARAGAGPAGGIGTGPAEAFHDAPNPGPGTDADVGIGSVASPPAGRDARPEPGTSGGGE